MSGAALVPEATAAEPIAALGAYEWFSRGLDKEVLPEEAAAAEECYRKALESDPGLAAAHTNLGGLAYRKGF